MNFVGKILVVLILVMSLVFMSFAVMVYATHKNWKEVVERKEAKPGEQPGLRIQLENVKKLNEELQGQLEKLASDKKRELADKAAALIALETQKSTVIKENELLVKERDDLSRKEKEAVAALDTSSQNLKELTEEVGTLRGEIRKALEDRDKQFAKVVKLTDDIHKTQQELARVQERQQQLVTQITHARELLAQYGKSIEAPLDPTPPPLRGKVLAINDEKMVEISLGSDDGLTVGHTVDVFRGDKYIGRLVVLTTATDKAVAKIDPKYTKTAVQTGDDVATKLRVSDSRPRDRRDVAPSR
jgi:hypothetical protein